MTIYGVHCLEQYAESPDTAGQLHQPNTVDHTTHHGDHSQNNNIHH